MSCLHQPNPPHTKLQTMSHAARCVWETAAPSGSSAILAEPQSRMRSITDLQLTTEPRLRKRLTRAGHAMPIILLCPSHDATLGAIAHDAHGSSNQPCHLAVS